MSVGVNIAPGWPGVYGANAAQIAQMNHCLDDLKPHTIRMPWVNNAGCINTWQRCVSKNIFVILEDDVNQTPEAVVAQIKAVNLPCFIEGINEPYPNASGGPAALFTPAQVAQITDRQTRLYKAVGGWAPVLSSPAYSIGPNAAANEATLISLPCDIANVHRYPDQWGAPPTADKAVMPATTKPTWVTEFGIPTRRVWTWTPPFLKYQVTEAQQAAWLPEFRDMLLAAGADRVCVYELENDGTSITSPQNNKGVYRHDGSPKPAAAALRG
jgi:hypothetical protein